MGVSAVGLLTPETMLEEILVLYQETYQLKRDPGEVQHSVDVAKEAHIEILEVIKACLQCRQDFSQLEEPRQAPKMQTEVEYQDQAQVACNYSSSI